MIIFNHPSITIFIKLPEIREEIVTLEDNLRSMIDTVMNRNHGTEWEDDSTIGWSKTKKTDLEGVKKSRKEKMPDQVHSSRLLDYGYIYHLKYIIEKNDKLFKPIFSNFSRTIELMEILAENRNPIMHTNDIEDYKKQLCFGIIGMINQLYEHWNKGYRNKAKGWMVEHKLVESKSTDKETAEQKFGEKISQINENMKSMGFVIEDTSKAGERIIRFKKNDGEISIKIGKTDVGNYGEYGEFWRTNLTIETENFQLMEEILQINNFRYRVLRWIIPEGLDAITTIHNIEKIRETHHSGSQTLENGKLTGMSINHYLKNGKNGSVRVDVMGGIRHPTTITLVFDGASPEQGFVNAHKTITPDELLTIMYGDRTPNQVKRLIDETC